MNGTAETSTSGRTGSTLADLAMGVVVLGAAAFGFSLDRYPGFYIDDAFFAYPALHAKLGGSFSYAVSGSAPFSGDLWAYHGPALPHLLQLLFTVFGFSVALSRLPDFLGGWLAVLLMVVGLKRRGYRYAGFGLAVLWCGDRSNQEVMYGRMDGLALLCLVGAFLCLGSPAARLSTRASAVWCGVFCGLAMLFNPLCATFVAACFVLLVYFRSWGDGFGFVLGGAVNLVLLLPLWDFKIREALAQFFWHAHRLQGAGAWLSFAVLLSVLRWSRYWFLALLIFAMVCVGVSARELLRRGREMDERWREFVCASAFGLASLEMIVRPSTHPYYIVYFALWPMLCLVTLAERFPRAMRLPVLAMALIWCSSLAWNMLRVRESVRFHAGLSRRFLDSEVNAVVPRDAGLVTTPELYAVPLEAGHTNFQLTRWFAERQDACPRCYVLLKAQEYRDADYIARANLARRTVLYAGEAFPGAGPMRYPVVILSPEEAVGGGDTK